MYFGLIAPEMPTGAPRLDFYPSTTPSLESMQKMVGGLIEPIFTVQRPGAEPDKMITGYVNEEFLFIFGEDAPDTGTVNFPDYFQPWKGNMVIVGLDYATGDSVALTEEDKLFLQSIWSAKDKTLNLNWGIQ